MLAMGRSFRDSILENAGKHPEALKYLAIDPQNPVDNFGLRDEFLFQTYKAEALVARGGQRNLRFNISRLPKEVLIQLRGLLHDLSLGLKTEQQLHNELGPPLSSVLQVLRENGNIVAAKPSPVPIADINLPGVYRLQHASVLYRTRSTGILVDPHFHTTYEPSKEVVFKRSDFEGKVDAILISHSHLDHWWLSSLMMFDVKTPIFVPWVPKSTIICDNMAQRLRELGFENVIDVEWHSEPIIIGDIEISVLPFYGEQPVRYERMKHPSIRNWGNTYVVRSKHYSSWFLIDSGADVEGSMVELAEAVQKRFGRIDFILSNLRKFHIYGPSYINGGLNWLTLSPAQMQRFSSMTEHCTTLGPENVARVCKLTGARYYLPYAHWWGQLGEVGNCELDPADQREMALLAELQSWLARLSCETAITPWRIGDGFVVNPDFRVVPIASGPTASWAL